jgi:hypothetical protein
MFRRFKRNPLAMVGEEIFCHQQNRRFIADNTAFPKAVPWHGANEWRTDDQKYFAKTSGAGRPFIRNPAGSRQ